MPRRRKRAENDPTVIVDGQEFKVTSGVLDDAFVTNVTWKDSESQNSASMVYGGERSQFLVEKVYENVTPHRTMHASFLDPLAHPPTCTEILITGQIIKDITLNDKGEAVTMTVNDKHHFFPNPPYSDDQMTLSAHERGCLAQFYGDHPYEGFMILYDRKTGAEIDRVFDISTFLMGKKEDEKPACEEITQCSGVPS